jgi:hypothetical protein
MSGEIKIVSNGERERKVSKAWMFLGIAFIIIGLLVSLSSSIFENTITFSNYGGVIIESNDELSFSNSQIARAGSDISSAGTDPSTAVLMTIPPFPIASNGVPKGNWYYRINANCISGTTPANQVFKIELYRWDSSKLDYDLIGTLYIKSDADPSDNEGARLYFNIGGLPSSSEAFMIVVSRV